MLSKALLINASGIVATNKKDKDLRGPKDAVAMVLDRINEGMLVSDRRALGGSIKQKWGDIADAYQKTKEDNLDNRLMIPTTFKEIDEILGGLRRKNLIGVLGYAGQQKSTEGSGTVAFTCPASRFVMSSARRPYWCAEDSTTCRRSNLCSSLVRMPPKRYRFPPALLLT